MQRDLGEAFHVLGRAVLAAEEPVLRELDLGMWDYAVLVALDRRPAGSQAELAAGVGRDPTRIIPVLDRLAARALVRRVPDPADRRLRTVELTDAGRELLAACRVGIRAVEAELLAGLDAGERDAFVAVLGRLVDRVDPR